MDHALMYLSYHFMVILYYNIWIAYIPLNVLLYFKSTSFKYPGKIADGFFSWLVILWNSFVCIFSKIHDLNSQYQNWYNFFLSLRFLLCISISRSSFNIFYCESCWKNNLKLSLTVHCFLRLLIEIVSMSELIGIFYALIKFFLYISIFRYSFIVLHSMNLAQRMTILAYSELEDGRCPFSKVKVS